MDTPATRTEHKSVNPAFAAYLENHSLKIAPPTHESDISRVISAARAHEQLRRMVQDDHRTGKEACKNG